MSVSDLELLVPVVDLGMVRGDTNTWQVAITRGDEVVDLTGCAFWFTAKYRPESPDEEAIFQKIIGTGIDVVDAPGGILQITISPVDTGTLTDAEQPVYYDLQMREPDGTVTTMLTGRLLVTMDVTKA